MNIAPKTAAAAGAGSVSIAFVEIIAWILGYWNITVPPGVGASLATVFAAVASYFAPRSQPPVLVTAPIELPNDPVSATERWNTQK